MKRRYLSFVTSVFLLTFGFQTAWTESSSDKSGFTFAVYGDNREGWGNLGVHRQIVKKIREESPSLTLHTGDLVAKGGRKELWKIFPSRSFLPSESSFF